MDGPSPLRGAPDAPTQRLAAITCPGPNALERRRAIDPTWRPSPRPRSTPAASLIGGVECSDLASAEDRFDQDWDALTDPRSENGPSAAPTSGRLPQSLNARTLVLAGIAALMMMAGGGLWRHPMAPPAGEPILTSSGASAFSAATVVPAVLQARSSAPASRVLPGGVKAAPSAAVPGTPLRAAGDSAATAGESAATAGESATAGDSAATAGESATTARIPGMMGTPVPLTAPGQAGPLSHLSMPTALTTARMPASSAG